MTRNIAHGHVCNGRASPTYNSWASMLQRCYNLNSPYYYRYGGRGIIVCEYWHQFENFLTDMGERPEGKTLDRYPNKNGNYELTNCRWATKKEQARNRNSSIMLRINGIEKCVIDWVEEYKVPYNIICNRLKDGWSIEQAVTIPIEKKSERELEKPTPPWER